MTHHAARITGRWPVRAMVAAAAIALLGCGGDTEPTSITPLIGPTVAVSVSPPALSLVVGDGGSFSARGVDSNNRVTGGSYTWSSADPSIATVRQVDGYVVAVAPGSTTVTAISGTLSATATVSVRPPDPPVSVSISPNAVSFIPGSVDRLVARAIDSTGRVASVSFEWVSADPAVATVGKTDGIVTAIAPGSTTVTATTGTLSATVTVSVIEFAGSFAFTRTSSLGAGSYAADVLSSSGPDRMLQPLPRASEFGSIAAPAWSPDGTLLVVEVIQKFFGPPDFEWLEYNSNLYVLDAAAPTGSPWRALTTNGLSTSPSWSPNGRQIAYVEETELFSYSHLAVIDVGSGAVMRLTQAEGYYSKPRWSPDGTRLAFTASLNGSGYQSFVVNADGSGWTSIATGAASTWDPNWSPDGARLAFIRFRNEAPGSYQFDVMVADVDGKNARQVTTSTDWSSAPAWSPDGRRIMFSSGGALRVMNADGSGLIRITSPPSNSWDSAPVWHR